MSRLTIFYPLGALSSEGLPAHSNGGKKLVPIGFIALLVFVGACAASEATIPPPRSVVIYSGARLRVEHERMLEVSQWVNEEQTNIVEDPSFLVVSEPGVGDVYPWNDLRIEADTVWVRTPMGMQDPQLVYQIYGHLHLMVTMGRQAEWLPEAPDATGFELERAILSRAADAWILGRTVYGTSPYGPLDELAYTQEAGLLEPFIFTARPDEFATTRTEWARANPGEMERNRDWFLDTFSREPPGLRPS